MKIVEKIMDRHAARRKELVDIGAGHFKSSLETARALVDLELALSGKPPISDEHFGRLTRLVGSNLVEDIAKGCLMRFQHATMVLRRDGRYVDDEHL